MIAAGIYYESILKSGLPWNGFAIIHMNMTVNKIFWMIFFQKTTKAFKAPMRKRIKIIETACRGMGQKNIKTAGNPESGPQLPDTANHFLLCIHMTTIPVPIRAAKPNAPRPISSISIRFAIAAFTLPV